MALRFLGNYYLADSRRVASEQLALQRQWMKDKVIGKPEATNSQSVAELKAIGMVGVYLEEPC